MPTGRPIGTDLIYLARDTTNYYLTWEDFQNRVGVEENDLALIYRPSENRSFAVRVGDLWNASAKIEDTDMFITERGIRGAFNKDDPDDPAYFGRLYHANPVILRYIEIELDSLPNNPGVEPSMELSLAAFSYGGSYARLIEPDGTETALSTTRTEYTVSGAGTYRLMGEFSIFEISSEFQVGAGNTPVEVWNPMMIGGNIGKNLFSNITSLVSVPSGAFKPKQLNYMFPNTGMDFDASETADWDTSEATTAAYAFYNTSGNPDISNWDLSNVENMYRMFARSSDFDGYLDMSSSNVVRKNLAEMFAGATAFNNQQWASTVSSPNGATNLHKMFDGAEVFNQSFGITGGNALVKDAVDVSYMFANTKAFNQDLPNWNISGVVTAKGMFHKAVAFNAGGLVVNPIESHSNVWSNQYVDFFSGTQAYNSPLTGWDFTNIFDLSGLFRDAVAFNHTGPSAWNVETLQTYDFMFANTAEFNQPLGEWKTFGALSMENMFENAAVFNQDISSWCVLNIEEEPTSFSVGSPIEVTPERNPQWGECPPLVVRPLRIRDASTKSETDTEAGHSIEITTIRLDPTYEGSYIRSYQLNMDDGKGWVRVKEQGSSDVRVQASWAGGRIRLKNEYFNSEFYPDGFTAYSNELLVAVLAVDQNWFGFTHNNPQELRFEAYGSIQYYNTLEGEWNWYEYDGEEGSGTNYAIPGVNYRVDSTFPLYSNKSVKFLGSPSDSSLVIFPWSSLGRWNNTYQMFYGMRGWGGQDLTFLDVSKVVNAAGMFGRSDTTMVNMDLTGFNWNQVETTSEMFTGCNKAELIKGIDTWTFGSKWHTSSKMFVNCSKFNQDLSGWNLGPNMKSVERMFDSCSEFDAPIPTRTTATASRFNTYQAFNMCSKFNQAVDGWATNLYNAEKMFNSCISFNHPSISNWNPTKVVHLNGMFTNCRSLDQEMGNMGRFSPDIFNITAMFAGCHSLTGAGGFANWNMPNCKYFESVFYDCRSLANGTDFSDWKWSTYGSESNAERLGKFTTFFYNIGAVHFTGLETWNMIRVGNLVRMFKHATNFDDPSIANWDCKNVINVSEMMTQSSEQNGQPRGKFNQDLTNMRFPRITKTYMRNDVFHRTEIADHPELHPKWGQ